MAEKYTEADKMLFASFVMMEVMAFQAENDIDKARGRVPKYDERDFCRAEKLANQRMTNY